MSGGPAVPAPAPRRAATVLVLRMGDAGVAQGSGPLQPRSSEAEGGAACIGGAPGSAASSIEVLLVRRSRQASFMADAYVFPGGRIDEADGVAGSAEASRRAAARELAEEVGLVLPEPLDRRLTLFARWITPSLEPKRFDTDFFLAALPDGQVAQTDQAEVFDLLWLTPAEALSRYERGALKLPPPTRANLEDLQGLLEDLQVTERLAGQAAGGHVSTPLSRIDALLSRCAQRRPEPVLPKLVPQTALKAMAELPAEAAQPESTHAIAIVLPWDPEYPDLPGEGQPLPPPPAGPGARARASRYLLTEGRWWARHADAAPRQTLSDAPAPPQSLVIR